LVESKWRGRAVGVGDRHGGKLVLLDNSKSQARVLLDLLLQMLGKFLIAFGGYDRERVHVEAALSVAVLIDAEPQAAADRLPPLALRPHFAQGANLEDVGIVPAFFERRMRKDEFQ